MEDILEKAVSAINVGATKLEKDEFYWFHFREGYIKIWPDGHSGSYVHEGYEEEEMKSVKGIFMPAVEKYGVEEVYRAYCTKIARDTAENYRRTLL